MHEKIENKEELKLFFRHLKEYNVYKRYFRTLSEDIYFYYMYGKNYVNFFNSEKPKNWLLAAFFFRQQIEGFAFWTKINNKWIEILNEIQWK
jgi:hypothetical protein